MNNLISIPKSLFEKMNAFGGSISKSEVSDRNRDYMAWVTSMPCLACGATVGKIDAHHVISDGMALKCPDEYTVPLCHRSCHLDGIHMGQETFLKKIGLYERYGYHALQLSTLIYMAYFILSRDETERGSHGSPTRQVAYRFHQMAGDSRLVDYLPAIHV